VLTTVLLILAALALGHIACSSPSAEFVTRGHPSMGSELRITLSDAGHATADKAFDAAFAEVDRLDALLSVWKPGSDVLRINAGAGRAPAVVGRDTIEVLLAARQLNQWTSGKFDVTFGALADVWKFDHDTDERLPTDAEIAARIPLLDYRQVVIDETASSVFITRPGMRIHLGGIGKGYAVDRVSDVLRRHGFQHFMVQFGGDLYVAGQPGSDSWRLGISDPRGPRGDSFATVELRDATLSTSGDYERFFIKDGQRYHHLLDPDTGQPARGCRSVSIVARTATMADGLSTGVFILGPQAGMALVERLPDVEAVIVTEANEVLISSGLRGKLTLIHPPTAEHQD
jgi:thiamine biosynthesis lipoprotein